MKSESKGNFNFDSGLVDFNLHKCRRISRNIEFFVLMSSEMTHGMQYLRRIALGGAL